MIARTEMFDPNPGYVPACGPQITNRFGYIKLTVADPNGKQIAIKIKVDHLLDMSRSIFRILNEEAEHLGSECERDQEIQVP